MGEKEVAKKTLKERNAKLIWTVVAANAVLYAWFLRQDVVAMPSLTALAKSWETAVPAGMMFLLTVALNGVLSPATKARLVFWRWREVLPGHRAFTHFAKEDPRVDFEALERQFGSFPTSGLEQNRRWVRLYRSLEERPKVEHINREYLLLRDWTGLAALACAVLAPAAWWFGRSRDVAVVYALVVGLQYVIVRTAAKNAGERLVTTVLSEAIVLQPV